MNKKSKLLPKMLNLVMLILMGGVALVSLLALLGWSVVILTMPLP